VQSTKYSEQKSGGMNSWQSGTVEITALPAVKKVKFTAMYDVT